MISEFHFWLGVGAQLLGLACIAALIWAVVTTPTRRVVVVDVEGQAEAYRDREAA